MQVKNDTFQAVWPDENKIVAHLCDFMGKISHNLVTLIPGKVWEGGVPEGVRDKKINGNSNEK